MVVRGIIADLTGTPFRAPPSISGRRTMPATTTARIQDRSSVICADCSQRLAPANSGSRASCRPNYPGLPTDGPGRRPVESHGTPSHAACSYSCACEGGWFQAVDDACVCCGGIDISIWMPRSPSSQSHRQSGARRGSFGGGTRCRAAICPGSEFPMRLVRVEEHGGRR